MQLCYNKTLKQVTGCIWPAGLSCMPPFKSLHHWVSLFPLRLTFAQCPPQQDLGLHLHLAFKVLRAWGHEVAMCTLNIGLSCRKSALSTRMTLEHRLLSTPHPLPWTRVQLHLGPLHPEPLRGGEDTRVVEVNVGQVTTLKSPSLVVKLTQ